MENGNVKQALQIFFGCIIDLYEERQSGGTFYLQMMVSGKGLLCMQHWNHCSSTTFISG
jgi:hypothetical protein